MIPQPKQEDLDNVTNRHDETEMGKSHGLHPQTKKYLVCNMYACIFNVCVFGEGGAEFLWCTCEAQKTTLCSLFPFSTFTWALGIELRLPGLGNMCLFLLILSHKSKIRILLHYLIIMIKSYYKSYNYLLHITS